MDYLADKRASAYLLQRATLSWCKYTADKRARVRQETQATQRFACRRAQVLLCTWERERVLQQVAHLNFVRVARAFLIRCLRIWHVYMLAVNKAVTVMSNLERAGALSAIAAWRNLIRRQQVLMELSKRAHGAVLVGRKRMCLGAWRSTTSMHAVCEEATDRWLQRLCVRTLRSDHTSLHAFTCIQMHSHAFTCIHTHSHAFTRIHTHSHALCILTLHQV